MTTPSCIATTELEEADVEQMRLIAIESRIEWRGFTDEMKTVSRADRLLTGWLNIRIRQRSDVICTPPF